MTRSYALLTAALFCTPLALLAQCGAGEVEVTIEVTTDDYGYETYWQLVPGGNPCGTGTIFAGGNLTMSCSAGGYQLQNMTGYANSATIVEGPWCLNLGSTYDIYSVDDWGDSQATFEVFVDGVSIATFNAPGATNVFTFAAQPPQSRDMGVTDLTTALFGTIGEPITIRGTITSFGSDPVSNFDLKYSIDGGAPVSQTITGLNMVASDTYDFEHSTTWIPGATGQYTLSVWADNINGGADMNTVNDAAGSDHIINYGIPNIIDDILALPAPVIFNIANSNEDLLVPRDLAFHPDLSRNELWVLNKDTEASGSSTVKFTNVGEDGQTYLMQEDPNNWHFMSLSTGIAFSDNGNFATSPGVFDANHNGGQPFTGISLWSSDPAIYAQNIFGPLGSHLDMLHVTPNAQGIAHESWNRFWAVDGYNQDVVMHDFKGDHGPGNDYHGNAVIRRYSSMTITRDPNDHIVSHCVLDKNTNWLYVVDHGAQRVLRLDITTGTAAGAPTFGPFETYVEYTQMSGETWDEVATTGLVQPAGIAIIGNRLLVSDHSNGDIVVYDVADPNTPEIGRIVTNSPGIMGIEIGPDGAIWAVNATTHELLKIAHTVSIGMVEAERASFEAYPVPANEVVRFKGLEAGPADRFMVYDAVGQVVLDQDVNIVQRNGLVVSGLADGHYTARSMRDPSRSARFTVAR
ncbi:MAG: hypothetical protein IPI55_02500 [Flavobacteriales bacterium]|nr:hypothetical protein [Flavobacteriales bacterium]